MKFFQSWPWPVCSFCPCESKMSFQCYKDWHSITILYKGRLTSVFRIPISLCHEQFEFLQEQISIAPAMDAPAFCGAIWLCKCIFQTQNRENDSIGIRREKKQLEGSQEGASGIRQDQTGGTFLWSHNRKIGLSWEIQACSKPYYSTNAWSFSSGLFQRNPLFARNKSVFYWRTNKQIQHTFA